MPLSSMTGFARVDGDRVDARWTWELKSVNGRGIEARFRLPPGYEFLEHDLRKILSETFSRGSFSAFLSIKGAAVDGAFVVNRAALDSALKLIEEIRLRIDCERPRPEGVLALRGVIDQESALDDDDARAGLAAALKESFRAAARALAEVRGREGETLVRLIEGQLNDVDRLALEARISADAAPDAIKARIAAQLSELLAGAVPAERLQEEAALLAVKADVREELDRLGAHAAAARSLLAVEGAVGRKLDFLTQELNREANTLCSKAQGMALKRIGLDLKTAVDQMREQIQNVE